MNEPKCVGKIVLNWLNVKKCCGIRCGDTPKISNDRWWGTSWGLPWSNMLCWVLQGHSKFIPPSSTKGIWTLVAIETIPNKTIEDVGLMVKPKRIIENSFSCHFVLIKTSSPSSAANSSHARCKEILHWNPCATELGCFLRKAEKHNFWQPMITDFESIKYLYTLRKNQPKRPSKNRPSRKQLFHRIPCWY